MEIGSAEMKTINIWDPKPTWGEPTCGLDVEGVQGSPGVRDFFHPLIEDISDRKEKGAYRIPSLGGKPSYGNP